MRAMRLVTVLTIVVAVLAGAAGPWSAAKGSKDAPLPDALTGAVTVLLETIVMVPLTHRLRRHWLCRVHAAPKGRR